MTPGEVLLMPTYCATPSCSARGRERSESERVAGAGRGRGRPVRLGPGDEDRTPQGVELFTNRARR